MLKAHKDELGTDLTLKDFRCRGGGGRTFDVAGKAKGISYYLGPVVFPAGCFKYVVFFNLCNSP